jgi:hypothetical protein
MMVLKDGDFGSRQIDREVVGRFFSALLDVHFHKDVLAMAIHRARYTLAVIALLGLIGCKSSSNNATTASKTNPFGSNVAANGAKTPVPAKPSTQVPVPGGPNAPAASGLASQPGSATPSSRYPGTPASFNQMSAVPGGAAGAYPAAPQTSMGSPATADSLTNPQRGYYQGTTSPYGSPAQPAGPGASPAVTNNPYVAGAPGTSAGFKSGARDYTSGAGPTDYTASTNTGNARSSVITPRYSAAADRYGADNGPVPSAGPDRYDPMATRYPAGAPSGASDRYTPSLDRSSPSTDRYSPGASNYNSTLDRNAGGVDRYPAGAGYGNSARQGSAYDSMAVAPSVSGTPYGSGSAYSAAPPAGAARGSASDPYSSAGRPSAAAGAGLSGGDRISNPYGNALPSTTPSRPTSAGYDRAGTASSRDYPSTNAPVPSGNSGYGAPPSNYPSNSGYGQPAGGYAPGNGGYNAPAADSGYAPQSASPYRSSTGSAPAAAAPDSEYRPFGTSSYAPKSAANNDTLTAARAASDIKIDSSVKPASYSTDYLR